MCRHGLYQNPWHNYPSTTTPPFPARRTAQTVGGKPILQHGGTRSSAETLFPLTCGDYMQICHNEPPRRDEFSPPPNPDYRDLTGRVTPRRINCLNVFCLILFQTSNNPLTQLCERCQMRLKLWCDICRGDINKVYQISLSSCSLLCPVLWNDCVSGP